MEIDENITEDELVIRCGSLRHHTAKADNRGNEYKNAASCDETKVRVSADTW